MRDRLGNTDRVGDRERDGMTGKDKGEIAERNEEGGLQREIDTKRKGWVQGKR